MSETASSNHIALYSEPARVDEPPIHHNDAIGKFDRYWLSLHQALGRFPSRKDLDPVAMGPAALPWMLLVELREDEDGVFFYYRLCGTELANLAGQDVTGKTTRDVIVGGNVQVITEPYLYTFVHEQPSFWQTAVFHEIYHWRPVVRGVWPLSNDGGKIDMFVNLTVPVQSRPKAGG
ncbi:PAS domain-containing protein [Pelagibius sp. Alg239-R121]|uniref:PAS domain-containing protein n=1 Tax=Pelagibius sp. Alg239-R121 TaxID=2993448 RepID=UPI0024A6AF46|nr:PAS domain-containing protein [Pelagibius sp. Alg239-R121]